MPEMPISRHSAGTDIDGGNNWNRMLIEFGFTEEEA
jgi:Fe2+ transport system protein FeoA